MREELKLIELFETSSKFINENFEELQTKYPNEFVAVRGNQILDHDKNPKILLKRLEEKGEDLITILIEFIPEKDLQIIYRVRVGKDPNI